MTENELFELLKLKTIVCYEDYIQLILKTSLGDLNDALVRKSLIDAYTAAVDANNDYRLFIINRTANQK